MMKRGHDSLRSAPRDQGFSLVEMLVAMGLFGVLGTLLLGLALSTSQVTDDTRNLASVNEEARLAMERMVRELRQASDVLAVQLPASATEPTALTFWTDFDGDGLQDLNAADPEVLTYRWNPATSRLTLTANDASGTAITRPVLAANVSDFVLGLHSSKWQYDRNADGLTTWQELDQSGPPVGDADNLPDDLELHHIDLVSISMTVSLGDHTQTYSTQVDLRNRN
jgi:prepilin-type N-terminal cleavage/methylation domain-containing protein